MATAVVDIDTCNYFDKVANAKERVLLLDYDGTLAPFVTKRLQAQPYPGFTQLLNSIMSTCNTRVAVISGRPAWEVRHLLAIEPAPETWGCHGVERILADGSYYLTPLPADLLHTFRTAERALAAAGLEQQTEVKLGAVAVHWRGHSAPAAESIRSRAYDVLGTLVSTNGPILAEFDGGVELRIRTRDKGHAVRTIISELDPSVAVAYLGDDRTDEDAFRSLNGRGLTVLVRPTYRFTAAQLWLQPPHEVRQFFMSWIRACGGMYE